MKFAPIVALAASFVANAATTPTTECTSTAAPKQTSLPDPLQSKKGKLEWGPCRGTANDTLVTALQCATLKVPLDYQNPSESRTLTLDLTRLPAKQSPSKGNIIYNPGGPGNGGRNYFAATAALGYVVLPGAREFDWVTFDPRGTNPNVILANCFNETESAATAASMLAPLNNSLSAVTAAWNSNRKLWHTCEEKLGENGTLIGSVYTARDMLAIVDALGGDGMLRYYGDSYGTVIGQLFARLFPNRVGRMVLDGVVNLEEYLAGTFVQEPSSIDPTLAGFIGTCEARPDICDLTLLDTSRKSVSQQVNELLNSLAAGDDTSFSPPLTWQTIALKLYSALKTPSQWSLASTVFYTILTHNETALNSITSLLEENTATQNQVLSLFNQDGDQFFEIQQSIRCSDVLNRVPNPAADVENISILNNQSSWGGPIIAGTTQIPCTAWPFKAKEQYTGNSSTVVKTKNPILVVNNIFDPITPLVSARQASLGFEGSRLLVQNAYGHTTGTTPSACTNNYIREYLAAGTLPPNETVCDADVAPFFSLEEYADADAIQRMVWS